jgi:hypothetical protein
MDATDLNQARPAAPGLIEDASLEQARQRRRSRAWWLKVVGVAVIGISALIVVVNAATSSSLATFVVALVIGAFAYLGWRKPRAVGVLLIVFAPLETLNVLSGAMMIVESNAVVIECLVFFGGLPLVAGVLLTAAARSRRGSS